LLSSGITKNDLTLSPIGAKSRVLTEAGVTWMGGGRCPQRSRAKTPLEIGTAK